jgi:putative Holliday junction resolvase
MRSLGLDIGDKRIGVALSDALGMLARPLVVIERQDDEKDVAAILALVKEHSAQQIIAGLPRTLAGAIGPQAAKVQAFAQILSSKSAVPVQLRDERLSTVSAKRLLQEGGRKKPPGGKGRFDAAAAAVILQGYLDENQPLPAPPEEQA